jgi:hypothetical protein
MSQSQFSALNTMIQFFRSRDRRRSPKRRNRGNRKQKYIKNTSDAFGDLEKVDWSIERLESLKKHFYHPERSVYSRKSSEIERWREAKEIKIKGTDIPNPVLTFEEAGFPRSLVLAIKKAGFETPTSIQSQSWPISLSGEYEMIKFVAEYQNSNDRILF